MIKPIHHRQSWTRDTNSYLHIICVTTFSSPFSLSPFSLSSFQLFFSKIQKKHQHSFFFHYLEPFFVQFWNREGKRKKKRKEENEKGKRKKKRKGENEKGKKKKVWGRHDMFHSLPPSFFLLSLLPLFFLSYFPLIYPRFLSLSHFLFFPSFLSFFLLFWILIRL